jgi:hypothetical protein
MCDGDNDCTKCQYPEDADSLRALCKELAEALVLSRDCNYHGGQIAVLGRVNATVSKAVAAKLLDPSQEIDIDSRGRGR